MKDITLIVGDGAILHVHSGSVSVLEGPEKALDFVRLMRKLRLCKIRRYGTKGNRIYVLRLRNIAEWSHKGVNLSDYVVSVRPKMGEQE